MCCEKTQRTVGSALIFITHNPALLAGFADRVVIMYGGRLVEEVLWRRLFGGRCIPIPRAYCSYYEVRRTRIFLVDACP